MRLPLVVLTSALLLAGCGGERPAGDTPQEQPGAASPTEAVWSTTLRPGSDQSQLRGSATAEAREGRTAIRVELVGGEPGATHPWHVHQGACGSGGGYFHESESYPPLHLDDQGRGTAAATVPAELQPGQEYHVNVHGADDHDHSAACGELRRS